LGEKVGSETLILWSNKYINPHINISVETTEIDGKRVEILCIDPGYRQPVKFKKTAYIRIGSAQQPLSNYPERERTLWQITSKYSFETSLLSEHFTFTEIEEKFSIDIFLAKIGKKKPTRREKAEFLTASGLIRGDMQGKYEVSALLAIAAGRDLTSFSALENKGSRVVHYKGTNKLQALDDKDSHKGHLVTFVGFLQYVMDRIPSREELRHGIRTKVFAIPELAIREFLANSLVHQDFTDNTSKPVVEIFKDRVRISNPGTPLVDVDRFIDTPSKSRNPKFAKLMRDAGFCEERGSGVDRAITEIEKASLPPPLIEEIEGSTVVTVFMPRSFANMTPEERIRACFQHACLRHEQGDPMSNASLRARFGLPPKQYPQVSIVIRDALEAGRIKPMSEEQGNRNARYLPFYTQVS